MMNPVQDTTNDTQITNIKYVKVSKCSCSFSCEYLNMLKSNIREWMKRQHFRIWNLEEGTITAKRLLGPKNKNKISDALRLPRKDLSILIGALTGHMSINSFLFKLNLSVKFAGFVM
ncbi:hypothetical protein ACKWTF_016618 [Chironomus riparius]